MFFFSAFLPADSFSDLIFINLLRLFQSAMFKTETYLQRAIRQSGRRPYTVAIASYAIALLQKTPSSSPLSFLMRAAAPGEPHRSSSSSGLPESRSLVSDRLPFRGRPLARRSERPVHAGGYWLRPAGSAQTGTDAGGRAGLQVPEQPEGEGRGLRLHPGNHGPFLTAV